MIIIKTKSQEFVLDELCSLYLFSTFYTFFLAKNIIPDIKTVLKDNLIIDLKDEIHKSLNTLLAASYIEPSVKEVQKNPSRFEKILLDGKKYKVNYRMSSTGHLAYSLYCFINALEQDFLNKEEIIIQWYHDF